MRLQRLSAEDENGQCLTWEFDPEVTVIDVRDHARSSVAELIALALGSGVGGLTVEAMLDSGQRVVAFRPHNEQHMLVDVRTGADMSSRHRAPDGRVRVLPGSASTDGSELIVDWSEAPTSDLAVPEIELERTTSRHSRLRAATLVLGPALPVVGLAGLGTIGAPGTLALITGSFGLTAGCFAYENRVSRAHKNAEEVRGRVRASLAPVADRIRLGRRPGGELLPVVVNHRRTAGEARDPHRLLAELRRLGTERQLVVLTEDHTLVDASTQARSQTGFQAGSGRNSADERGRGVGLVSG